MSVGLLRDQNMMLASLELEFSGDCKLSSVGTGNQSQASYFVLIGGSDAVAIGCVT